MNRNLDENWKYCFSDPEISHEKIKLRHLSTQKLSVRNRIVDIHNHFRASVKPPAKNMLKLVSHLYSNTSLSTSEIYIRVISKDVASN